LIQAKTDANSSENNTGELKIVITLLEIDDKALKLSYDIKNDSADDAWVLAETGLYAREFTMRPNVFIAKDRQTLTICKTIDLPIIYMTGVPTYGNYVRLRPGESQTESVFITIPVYPIYIKLQEQGLKYATRLAIELGYYTGNLPERIFKKLKPPEIISSKDMLKYSTLPCSFNIWQERLISRDEKVSLPQVFLHFDEDENVLRTVVDNLHIPYLHIPYEERQKQFHQVKYEPPDLTNCTKIEVMYRPSMLEYFFPNASQQSLTHLLHLRFEELRFSAILARYRGKRS